MEDNVMSKKILPPLIPRELLFGEPERMTPKISPDGKRIAYLAPKYEVLNIWVRTIGKEDDKAVTQEKKRGIRQYFWAENNVHIIYLQDSDGDENWHVYAVDPSNEIIRDLTPFLGVQAQVVATDPNYPDQMLVGLNLRDRRVHDVYRLSLTTGALEKDTENPGDVMSFACQSWLADPNFQIRGAMAMRPDGGSELRVRPDVKSPWEVLVKWGAEDNFCGAIGFTPDGKGLYLVDSREANSMRAVQIDIDSSKQTVLAEDPGYDVTDYIIHPRTHKLQAICILKERAYWQVIDRSIKEDIERIKEIHKGDLFLLNRDATDKNWLIGFDCDDEPIPYYIYNRETHKVTFLFTNQPKIEKYKLAQMKPINLTSRDGLTLHGYLTLPLGLEAKNLPMVLKVHGGPWGRDVWRYEPEAQWLANRGYACLQINFRGSVGYGKKFLNAGNREWGRKMHDDLIDAVNWAIKEEIADPNHIAIYGGSYGGYATLVGAAFTPDVFKCAAEACGPSNLITFFEAIPPYWEPMRKLFYERIGNLDTEKEFLKSRSPLFKADEIKIPMLIGQGANDPQVKQAESEQIVNALRSKNMDVEYILFPDEGHGFVNPDNRLKFYAAVESFLSKHLGGRAEQ
jgi:dipeptidyl aminopeptidase/acylaminoacyl peptidase